MGMSLSKANKKIAQQKAIDYWNKKIEEGLNKYHKLVSLWILHEKFGFGGQRGVKYVINYEDLWTCIDKRQMTDLTLMDIEVAILAEMDIYISDDGNSYYFGKGNGKNVIKDGKIDWVKLNDFVKKADEKYEKGKKNERNTF